MAASAERCSTLIWRGLGGIAFRSVPRAAADPRACAPPVTLAAMRGRVGWSIAVAALVLALAAPARGQQAPTLGAPPSPNVTVQTTPSGTSSGGGGLKTWQGALIFAAGLILIGGVAVAVPAAELMGAPLVGPGGPGVDGGPSPAPPPPPPRRPAGGG